MSLTPGDYINYVKSKAPGYNLDAAAVLAVAQQEGLGGLPGDNNTSFGPHQLHIGGLLPGDVAARGASYAQDWAWSEEGFNYALQQLASVASGLRGSMAIDQIVTRFEKPSTDYGPTHRNLQNEEKSAAKNVYATWQNIVGAIPFDPTLPPLETLIPGLQPTPAGTPRTPGEANPSAFDTSSLVNPNFGPSLLHVSVSVMLVAIGLVVLFGGILLLKEEA